MDVNQFAMSKDKAYELWKDYVAACRENPTDAFLQDMKKVYNQIKSGRKVIDINVVFQRSGLTMNGEPRMAIAKATTKTVRCQYNDTGKVVFINRDFGYYNYPELTKDDVAIKGVFPKFKRDNESYMRMEAPVPPIPASLRPKDLLSNYYMLWEVEKWKKVPPRDPYLLRRITPNMFVVVAGWDLTELERSVMKGRVS